MGLGIDKPWEKFLWSAGLVSDLNPLALPHSFSCGVFTMLVPQLVLLLAAVGGTAALLRPINLTLCEKTSENVSRFLTDLYLVQPQQYGSCELANTSTPVVSHHHPSKYHAVYDFFYLWLNSLKYIIQLFRVNTSAIDTDLSTPVVFVARAERYVQTWRIPHELPQ